MKKGSIVPLPEFDLWGVPGTQVTVERVIDTEFFPLANTDSKIVTFKIKTNPDEYIKLDDLMISWTAQWKLVKNDKTELTQLDFGNTHLAAYALHSMIKEVNITINNKQISNLPQCYPYRAFIEALLGYSKDAKKTILSPSFWGDSEFKTSLKKDSEDKSLSIKYNMLGKLHSDLSFQGRYLLGGFTIGITIHLNEPSFYMKLPSNLSNATLNLTNVKLFLKKAKVNQAIVDAHRKALHISPAKYPITRTEIKHLNIASGQSDVWLDNFINGQLPRRMFLFLVKNDSFKGDFHADQFEFPHYSLNYRSFIDGVAYSNVPFTPDFQADNFDREYLSLFDALNQTSSDTILYLEKNVYKGNKVIYGFNFARDLSNGNAGLEGHINLPTEGTLRLQLRFKTALPDPIVAVTFCEFDDILLIDRLGQVSLQNV